MAKFKSLDKEDLFSDSKKLPPTDADTILWLKTQEDCNWINQCLPTAKKITHKLAILGMKFRSPKMHILIQLLQTFMLILCCS